MIEQIAQWARALIFTAAFCALALAVMPSGPVRKAGAFVCGLVCMAAILSPALKIDFDAYSEAMAKYTLDAQKLSEQASNDSENLNRLYIEDKCRAYILDKAKELGADIGFASVELDWSIDGFWYPVSAELSGSCAAGEKESLERCIEAELGIARSEQKWEVDIIE